jgi:uncharacterized phiE125 gp8 family phage protein
MNLLLHTGYLKCGRRFNAVIDVQRVDGSEYITLTEVKTHLKVDFTDDDTYITMLITAARQVIEKYTGLALVPTTVTAILQNQVAPMELPVTPYVSGLAITDNNNEAATIASDNYTLTGTSLVQLTSNLITVTYSAGYTISTLPTALKLAVLHEITWLYENRGDAEKISPSAKTFASQYKRGTWLI